MHRTALLTKSETIPSDTDSVWIDGRHYRVKRLPTSDYIDKLPEKASKDPYEFIRKQPPVQQRKSIAKLLKKEKAEALRARIGITLSTEVKKRHAEDLQVTEEEITERVRAINE